MHPCKFFVAVCAAMSVSACDNPNDRNIVVGELASDRIELIAESNEPILEIAVAEGASVTAGQLILRQDDVRASARLREAEARAKSRCPSRSKQQVICQSHWIRL